VQERLTAGLVWGVLGGIATVGSCGGGEAYAGAVLLVPIIFLRTFGSALVRRLLDDTIWVTCTKTANCGGPCCIALLPKIFSSWALSSRVLISCKVIRLG
jgi:hypothetical protein